MEFISVILAAGEGTRMKSKVPKVLHPVAGLPMVEHVLRAVEAVETKKNVIVCGSAIDKIMSQCENRACYAEQKERLGSGHAVMSAKSHLQDFSGYTLIVAGDMPLLRGETISRMVLSAQDNDFDCLLLSAKIKNPFGYGRIVRKADGNVLEIVEEKDATDEQRKINEVNASCYCVKNSVLLACLDRIKPKNAQGEYYLTDIVGLINGDGGKVGAFVVADEKECMGVNDREQLAEVAEILRDRIAKEHMKNGVSIIDPKTTYIDADTKIGKDTVIYPAVTLESGCIIGEDVCLRSNTRVCASEIKDGTTVENSVILNSEIGMNCTVGPFAYVRPNTKVNDNCRIGDFVELKNSEIGENTKVSHLTYIGDADFGKNINVGCGVVVVNYDGKNKHRSTVEDNAFIGCNTNLISPVTVQEDAYIAAGTTITKTVPKGYFAIARCRQENKENWKDKR